MFFSMLFFYFKLISIIFNIFAKDNPISRYCPSIEVTQTESGISRTEMSLYAFFSKMRPCLV